MLAKCASVSETKTGAKSPMGKANLLVKLPCGRLLSSCDLRIIAPSYGLLLVK